MSDVENSEELYEALVDYLGKLDISSELSKFQWNDTVNNNDEVIGRSVTGYFEYNDIKYLYIITYLVNNKVADIIILRYPEKYLRLAMSEKGGWSFINSDTIFGSRMANAMNTIQQIFNTDQKLKNIVR